MRFAVVMPLLVVGSLVAGCGPSVAPAEAPRSSAPIAACTPPAPRSDRPAKDGLPDITLECLGDGPAVRLSDLRGPLVINVWAQWCGPCRDEAPYLAALYRKAGDKLQLLGIDYVDPRPAKAVEFAAAHGLVYQHLRDPDKQVRQAFRITGPPVTAFVDRAGKVVGLHHGPFRSAAQLDQMVADHLGVSL